jgi:hypothetical protein
MTTVEFVATRVDAERSAMIAVIYRPRSDAIRSTFHDELALVFEAVATYQILIYVFGGFYVCFDCAKDSNTCQLLGLIQSFGFDVHPTAATHRDGGTIDAVIMCRTN